MEENRENIREANLIPFKKGESGNPNGRPKGRRNFSTIFYDALEKLAEKNGIPADQLETEIVEKALLSARKGDHKFYKDLMDRLHGQATQNTESVVKVEIEKITPENKEALLALLNDKTGS